ncbi:helix-turn-helix domain-containing protein [Kitasatospora sp. NPDC089509]|uniref:helix-turn-helix domain-containing protein n=1 Tax=Kitasatospora sp. NPDC089509 TaxID=3364079 RepID=UPI0037FA2EB4
MRYADGGGLTAKARQRRETVRLEAAALFDEGVKPPEVARQLRVSCKSAYQWHQAYPDRGGLSRAQATASRSKPSCSRAS